MPDHESGPWPTQRQISAAGEGNPEAIAAVLAGSHAQIRRFANTLCATPDEAEEAVQEALIALYRQIGTLRATAALGSWLFKVVLRECIRRTKRLLTPSKEPDEAQQVESAEEEAMRRMEVERIVSSIAALPDEQRMVFVLRDVRGLSGADTAQSLGLSQAAMKSRLHRARTTVRDALEHA